MNDSYQPIYDAVKSRISRADSGEIIRDAVSTAFGSTETRLAESLNFCSSEWTRPSVLYKPELTQREGGPWRAAYGAVVAWGDSPAKAMEAFDRAWFKEMEKI